MKDKIKSANQIIKDIVNHGFVALIGDAVSIQNRDFKILYQNQAHKDIIGDHVNEFCYRAYEKKHHVCEGCPVAMTFEDGAVYTKERSTLTERGTLHVEITASPLRDKKGEIIAGIEVVRDITTRKKSEEALKKAMDTLEMKVKERTHELEETVNMLQTQIAKRRRVEDKLRESEGKYRQLFSNELDAILIFDAETFQFIDANKAALDLYGYSNKEILNMKLTDLSAEVEKTIESVTKTREGDITIIPERYHKKKDGTIFPAEISPGTFMMGNRKMVCGIIRDITDRKEAERQIQQYQERLRALIYRLSVIEERERKNISEALHDNIGQYLALAKINLSKIRSLYPAIEKDVDETKKLIEQAIDFTRSLTFELSTPLLYQVGLYSATEKLIEEIEKRHGISVDFVSDRRIDKIKPEISIVLYKTVRELLYNVVKHAHAKKAVVTIKSKNNNINVYVVDNGKGFNLANIEPNSTENKGFGIFNIRERIRHIGGSFDINSKREKGTEVSVVIPT